MLRSLICAVVLLTAPLALAKPMTMELDPSHSAATFTVRHMMISNVKGEFGKMTGTAVYDPDNLAGSSVEVTVDATTINTRQPKRDAHLKSPDFFDVAKFPTLTFKSTKVEKNKLTGNLTMHGVTKPVTFDYTLTPPVKGMDGQMHMGANATAKVNRKDFGLNWNKSLEAGGVLVSEEVTINLDMELGQK